MFFLVKSSFFQELPDVEILLPVKLTWLLLSGVTKHKKLACDLSPV